MSQLSTSMMSEHCCLLNISGIGSRDFRAPAPLSHHCDLSCAFHSFYENACCPPRYFWDKEHAYPDVGLSWKKQGSETVGNRQEDPPDCKDS